MASAAEYTYIQAVAKAEGVRQAAKAAAFATYQAAGFAGTALAAYVAALLTADTTYQNSVQTALGTEGELLGTLGTSGPIGSNIAMLP